MRIFKTGTNIGKAIAGRVKGFPVWVTVPIKKPKKKHTCWILCPDCWVKAPKLMTPEASQKEYAYTIKISSETSKERDEALDHMIRCGQKEIAAGDKEFWLYAVDHSRQRSGLFTARLKYIFRVRQIPEEIS